MTDDLLNILINLVNRLMLYSIIFLSVFAGINCLDAQREFVRLSSDLKLPKVVSSLKKQIPEKSNTLKWSDFEYYSKSEKVFWDALPDWSNKSILDQEMILMPQASYRKRNAQGEIIDHTSPDGFSGYVKCKSLSTRIIYKFLDGYPTRDKSWYRDKQTQINSTSKNVLHGHWAKWYENGQKEHEINFKYGSLNGLWTSWHENGLKKRMVSYANGKLNGVWIQWDDNGQKTEEYIYELGEKVLITTWSTNGKRRSETNLKEHKTEFWEINGTKLEPVPFLTKKTVVITPKIKRSLQKKINRIFSSRRQNITDLCHPDRDLQYWTIDVDSGSSRTVPPKKPSPKSQGPKSVIFHTCCYWISRIQKSYFTYKYTSQFWNYNGKATKRFKPINLVPPRRIFPIR